MASGKIVLPDSAPLGFGFHPTDEEIVSHFLKNKMLGRDDLVQPITEVDVCKYEPWELPKFSGVESDYPEWFFFSTPHFRYGNGGRTNRATKEGRWKVTGKDQEIKARKTKKLIGTKKILVFHKGRVRSGVRTNWVMHEYHSVDNHPQRTGYAVCRLMKKDDECEDDNEFANSLLVDDDDYYGDGYYVDPDYEATTSLGRSQPYQIRRMEPQCQLWSTGSVTAIPIKAEEASSYASNDHPRKKEIGATRPPSEYLANAIVGIVLFLVFVREMVIYGQWGMQV